MDAKPLDKDQRLWHTTGVVRKHTKTVLLMPLPVRAIPDTVSASLGRSGLKSGGDTT
jgi:hypothetical protein